MPKVRENCNVGCEQEGCSREENTEWLVTKALKFPFRTRKIFFHLNWNGECEKECIQGDMVTSMVAGYHQWKLSFLSLTVSEVLWEVVWRVHVCFCCVVSNFFSLDIWSQLMSMSRKSEWLITKEHNSWSVFFLVRIWLILLILRYTEWVMWSLCFTIDRLALV